MYIELKDSMEKLIVSNKNKNQEDMRVGKETSNGNNKTINLVG